MVRGVFRVNGQGFEGIPLGVGGGGSTTRNAGAYKGYRVIGLVVLREFIGFIDSFVYAHIVFLGGSIGFIDL